ncbi:MAG: hypothetical protein KAI22_08825 [Gammaproteobacteria bacterium]|nr:hypothetical protein [Gammaproteobacteria bacterium]
MYSSSIIGSTQTILDDFKLDGMMIRYSQFVPRLYNFCLSLGMEAGKIMPSRAFCSDESQGFPIILLAKQFGAFPFNHGRVGGIVSTDRHGPHATHGQDMMIIQASHVGYEPENQEFGVYRRIQTHDCHHSTNCGKISGTLKWYLDEYHFACENIFLEQHNNGQYQVSINNLLLHEDREEGLLLELEKIIAFDHNGKAELVRSLSTARCFKASNELIEQLKISKDDWPTGGGRAIGSLLTPELFKFRRQLNSEIEGAAQLEKNLIGAMPLIVTHPAPALAAAQILTQVEFDRTYRTIINEPGYNNRNLLFISGLHIDISPREDQIFPLTKFVPWAAYIQKTDGSHVILEQQELFDALIALDVQNDQQIDLEKEIQVMEETEEVQISYDFLSKK